MCLIDELIEMFIENDLTLETQSLKNKIEEIETFYNQDTFETKYNEIMRKP